MASTIQRRFFYSLIVIAWAAVMAVLLFRQYVPRREPAGFRMSIPRDLFGEHWLGIYYQGRKVGYGKRTFGRTETGYSLSEEMKMSLMVMGVKKEVETRVGGRLRQDLGLESFQASLTGDIDLHISGTVEGDRLRLKIETPGSASERTIPFDPRVGLNLAAVPAALLQGARPGTTYSMDVIDPVTLGTERLVVTVTERRTVAVLGVRQDVLVIKGSLKGAEFSAWMTDRGDLVREESPLGFVLVSETREDAMRPGGSLPDIVSASAVSFDRKLPAGVRYLKVRISGIDPAGLDLDGGRQRLSGDVLEIFGEGAVPAGVRRGGTSGDGSRPVAEYDDAFIQSKAPEIVSLAGRIVRQGDDVADAASSINEWLFRNIEKTPSVTMPSALDVLRTMKGDCNEHTVLFVALARAAGIPARTALGLVYVGGSFYYHAWPEFFAGMWVAADPTFGQFPADASHIRLVVGDMKGLTKIVRVIGKIKLHGIDYR